MGKDINGVEGREKSLSYYKSWKGITNIGGDSCKGNSAMRGNVF